MLLPVHTLPAGCVMLTVGPPLPLPPHALQTLTAIAAVAVRPAPSVTVRFSVWLPFPAVVVSHEYVALVPLGMLCVESAGFALLSRRTNCVGEPEMLLA